MSAVSFWLGSYICMLLGVWVMLRCGVIHYVDPAGKEREYETVERTTRKELTGVDGVEVISMSAR